MTRHDALQIQDDGRRDDRSVYGLLRLRAVACPAVYENGEFIGRRHSFAFFDGYLPRRHVDPKMAAEDGADFFIPVSKAYHIRRAAPRFFAGLKNQIHRAVQPVLHVDQHTRRP